MLRISGYCLLQGVSFSPSQLEGETGFILRQRIEPGQLGLSGKYAGVPVPFGSAIIDFQNQENVDMLMVDSRVADSLLSDRELLLHLRITDVVVHFNVEYAGQCNLEFSPSCLERLARLKVPVSITCYSIEATDS